MTQKAENADLVSRLLDRNGYNHKKFTHLIGALTQQPDLANVHLNVIAGHGFEKRLYELEDCAGKDPHDLVITPDYIGEIDFGTRERPPSRAALEDRAHDYFYELGRRTGHDFDDPRVPLTFAQLDLENPVPKPYQFCVLEAKSDVKAHYSGHYQDHRAHSTVYRTLSGVAKAITVRLIQQTVKGEK